MMLARLFAGLLAFTPVNAVDRSKFRTCKDTGFCRRHRSAAEPKFSVLKDSVVTHGNAGVTALLQGEQLESPPLKLTMKFYDTGVCRMQVREANPATPRWEAPDIVLEDQLTLVEPRLMAADEPSPVGAADALSIEYLPGHVLVMSYSPFTATLYLDGEAAVVVNGDNKMFFEYHRSRQGAPALGHGADNEVTDKHQGKKIVGYWEDGLAIYEDGSREEKAATSEVESVEGGSSGGGGDGDGFWEESFGGHRDSKPLGPAAVGVDVAFPGSRHLYGLPEHASSLALPTTAGQQPHYSEPYRLYTLDVFEYELDEPMALYGGIPMVLSHTADRTVGAFWFNPSETFVDVEQRAAASDNNNKDSASTHWISESGIMDLMLLPGPSPKDTLRQFTQLVGTQALPPIFALGYHQCRWNYKDERDVAAVHAKFEEINFPYDVLWLDIEHTDGKRYFTWDSALFPNPKAMIEKLAAQGRKMVTIIDPHLKRDQNYYIHSEATAKGLYVKSKDGTDDYDGWCWPGSSSYLDFTAPHVRAWWAEQFGLDKYIGSTLDLYTWNDMNEPSVFNGPEVSMPKDAKNLQGIEHREWHNLYGMYQQRATAEGQVQRSGDLDLRPFVLSRAFYAGSQRFGAIWTGDNKAEWSHLRAAAPMLLSMGLGGLTFAGADVGGFFGNTDSELMVRWMQAGSYTPFFRGHAHHDAKRREPWMFGEPTTSMIRNAVMARYALLPYWYTLFYEASKNGVPTMRPLWFEYPTDEATFKMDDQWLVGSDILVKPVTSPGITSTEIYLPGNELWYDVDTLSPLQGPGKVQVAAPLEKVSAFQRGGSVVPRKMRLRRSASLMVHDPYTLYVALDSSAQASGDLYLDDETTHAHLHSQAMSLRRFTWSSNGVLKGEAPAGVPSNFKPDNRCERIVVAGLQKAPRKITLTPQGQEPRELTFEYDAANRVLTVRKPDFLVVENFEMALLD